MKPHIIAFCLAFISVFLPTQLMSHEVRPAYLEIRQQSMDAFQALWKVPAKGNMRLGIYVRLPAECSVLSDPKAFISDGAFVEHWTFRSPDALAGDTIFIDGLKRTLTDVLVRLERLDGTTQIELLDASRPYLTVTAAPTKGHVIWTYFILGVEHILLGIDHLLFVLALLLIVNGVGTLVKTITAFTLAHSVTLVLAALGFVHVPGPPVEAVIALSIAFVAMEILRKRQGHVGITAKSPWLVAFTFGLLHGFGFAGALSDIGLPENEIPLSLLFFNIGVEAGQLLFVAAVLILTSVMKKAKFRVPDWMNLIPPYAIGSLAMFWVIERVIAFL